MSPDPFCAVAPEVLRAFGAALRPLYGQRDSNTGQNDILAATRDALLPKLLSGEIRLTDADEAVWSV